MARPLTPAEIEVERQALIRCGALVVIDANVPCPEKNTDSDIEFLKSFTPEVEAVDAPAPVSHAVSAAVAPSIARGNGSDDNTILTLAATKALSKKAQLALRRKIQTDLFYLANNVLRNKNQSPLQMFHRTMCDFLLRCDPDIPMEAWSDIKERLLLGARGTLKSTITAAHLVQIILCNKNVRILHIAGTLDKAAQTVDLVRAYFQNEVIAYLWPEHQPVPWAGNEFTTPARTQDLRDATLFCGTFRSVNSGAHAEYISLDDCVNEVNTRTETMRSKTVDRFDNLEPVLEAGGYMGFTGTRWAADDLPAIIIERGIPETLDVLELPVWTLKEGDDIKKRDESNTLNPDDVDFLWPEKLNAAFLFKQYRKNPDAFNKQYLLRVGTETSGTSSVCLFVSMTPELLQARIIQAHLPSESETFVLNGDLSSISEEGKDPCAIISGVWNPNQKHLTIDRIILEKFEEEKVFLGAVRGLYESCTIQSSNRIHFRVENVREAKNLWAEKFQVASINAEFLYPSYERGAREKRVTKLFEAIVANQVHFGSACGHWEDIVAQFCGYNPRKSAGRADDVLDSVAQLYEYCQTILALKYVGFQMLPNPTAFDFDYTTQTPANRVNEHQARRDAEANEKSAADYYRKEHGTLVPHRKPKEDFSL